MIFRTVKNHIVFRPVHITAKCNHELLIQPQVWNNSAPIGKTFMKFRIQYFQKSVKKYSTLITI